MLQPLQDPLKRFTDQIVVEPSYIIFKDDAGRVYAKNGRTGQIEFSGTDAATVVSQSLSIMKERERIVLVGDLTFNSSINILKRVIYHHYGTMTLNIPAGEAGIVIGNATTRVDNCELFIYDINGQDRTRDGIKILNGSGNRISVNRIQLCRYAFYLKQESTDVVLGENYLRYALIKNNKKGLYIPAPPSGQSAAWAEGTQ